MYRCEETAEGSNGQRLAGQLAFAAMESLKALLAGYTLAFITKDHRVAIKGNTQLLARSRRRRGRQDGRRGDTGFQRPADIFGVGGKK
jgi:hypothetical protein